MKNHTDKPSPKGFTLIELLVVIAIIVVLAALTFVGARRGVQASKASTTVTNLKGLSAAIQGVQNEGVPMSNIRPGSFFGYSGTGKLPGSDATVEYDWSDLCAAYLEIADRPGESDVSGQFFVWRGDPAETLFQNPLSKHKFGYDNRGGGRLPDRITPKANPRSFSKGGFAYNSLLGGVYDESGKDQDGQLPITDREIKYPETTIILAESRDSDMGISNFLDRTTKFESQFRKQTHCLFIDGHVELVADRILNTQRGKDFYMEVDGPNKLRKPVKDF